MMPNLWQLATTPILKIQEFPFLPPSKKLIEMFSTFWKYIYPFDFQ